MYLMRVMWTKELMFETFDVYLFEKIKQRNARTSQLKTWMRRENFKRETCEAISMRERFTVVENSTYTLRITSWRAIWLEEISMNKNETLIPAAKHQKFIEPSPVYDPQMKNEKGWRRKEKIEGKTHHKNGEKLPFGTWYMGRVYKCFYYWIHSCSERSVMDASCAFVDTVFSVRASLWCLLRQV